MGLLSAVLLCFASVPAAQAANRTLDFESLPAGFPVGDQYDDGTLGAVQFDYDTTGYHYTGDFATYVQDWGSSASSGTHVAVLPYNRPPAARDRRRGHTAGAFGHSTSWLAFRYTHTSVAMNVGFQYAVAAPDIPFTLNAYNAAGDLITSNSVQVPQDGQVDHPISAFDGFGNIAYVEIDVPAHNAAMDDVTYDVPASPPPPDFGFSWPLRDSQDVTLGRGDSRDVTFSITRVNGSSGNIDFSASNVPAGVTATFTPNPDTAPGRSTVTMHLTATSGKLPPVVNQKVTVSATPDVTAGSTTRNIVVPVTALGEYDLRADGLEVTQGIQSGGPGQGLPQIQTGPSTWRYNGVRLVAFGYKTTVVRFYASAVGAPGGNAGADALLYGFDSSGRPLPGSPLSPDVLPAGLQDPGTRTGVDYATRLDELHSFYFTLPPTWLSGTISLRGHVMDQQLLFSQTGRECGGCGGNNDTTLTDVPFTQEAVVEVNPLKITYDDRTAPGSPHVEPPDWSSPFKVVNNMAPIDIKPTYWRGSIDITTHKEFHGFKGWVTRSFIADNGIPRADKGGEVLDDIDEWAEDYADVSWPVGILGYFKQYDGSTSDLGISHNGPLFSGSMPAAVVNYQRPYTSVAHELGHGLGRQHASPGCGGGANGQKAESWPDPFGYIRGVGVDFTRSGASGGPYLILGGNQGTGGCQTANPPDCGGATPAQPFDYMSYCANDGDAWISDIGWNEILNSYHLSRDRPSAHVARVHSLMVRGFMTAGGAQIDTVRPGLFKPVAVDAAATPFQLEAVDGAGHVIDSKPMQAGYAHSDHSGGAQPVVFFKGTLPTNGVAGVRVTDGGKMVAGRDRSAHAPTVKLLYPAGGSVVGRQPIVKVRWRAHDADQGPRDQGGLDVTLEYSADNGHTFSQIFMGSNTGSASLPRSYFSRSNRARLRISVGDGFNLTTFTSRPFRSLGAPPVVQISNPTPGLQLDQNGTLLLRGDAFDDAGHAITGRALTWLSGRTVIGHGEITSTTGLPAGLNRITLRATDRHRRSGTASVQVVLIQVVPAFALVRYPHTISRKAKSFLLTVRSSVTTTLRVGKASYTVGPVTRRLRVTVKPGRSLLRYTLRLGTGRLVVTRKISIARR